MAVCVLNLPKVQTNDEKKEKMKFRDIFTVIKKNDQLRWAVLLILLYNVAIQAIMGVATYYFSYVCNNAGMLSAFMLVFLSSLRLLKHYQERKHSYSHVHYLQLV